eukprot:3272790-Alexandrium_andersonii.AAC.1
MTKRMYTPPIARKTDIWIAAFSLAAESASKQARWESLGSLGNVYLRGRVERQATLLKAETANDKRAGRATPDDAA